jgi:hypothetical protein
MTVNREVDGAWKQLYVGFKPQVRRLSPQIVLRSICLYRSTTASGENALLRTIYSLAIGCHGRLIKRGIANSLKGHYRLNKYYRLINAMFSGEDTSTDRVARS